MNIVYLLLGGNQGDRLTNLKSVQNAISQQIGIINNQSNIYETAAWGVENQPAFLNQVFEVSTNLSAEEVLTKALEIEKDLGRVRITRWAERTIDIDILYFNHEIINTENLTVPHPEIQNRRFTLIPLCDIASNFIHPILQLSQIELLEKCEDKLEVVEFR